MGDYILATIYLEKKIMSKDILLRQSHYNNDVRGIFFFFLQNLLFLHGWETNTMIYENLGGGYFFWIYIGIKTTFEEKNKRKTLCFYLKDFIFYNNTFKI